MDYVLVFAGVTAKIVLLLGFAFWTVPRIFLRIQGNPRRALLAVGTLVAASWAVALLVETQRWHLEQWLGNAATRFFTGEGAERMLIGPELADSVGTWRASVGLHLMECFYPVLVFGILGLFGLAARAKPWLMFAYSIAALFVVWGASLLYAYHAQFVLIDYDNFTVSTFFGPVAMDFFLLVLPLDLATEMALPYYTMITGVCWWLDTRFRQE